MTQSIDKTNVNRRQFLKQSGSLAAGAAVLGSFPTSGVYAAQDETIRLVLIGCGGRGSGAVSNALSVPDSVRRPRVGLRSRPTRRDRRRRKMCIEPDDDIC